MSSIADNLAAIHQHIRDAELQYQRASRSVALLAVSKQQSATAIRDAYAAGQRAFGESYLQEALQKMSALSELGIEWHFIGSIQRNKTRHIATHFDWVHSVTDALTLERLQAQRPLHLPPLNICLQVNISDEHSKSGITDSDALLTLAKQCATHSRLRLRGLMTIPIATDNVAMQRHAYHKLKLLSEFLYKNGVKLDTLSMGMSQDMNAAIAEGATLVRIGTKIFGERK